MITAAEWEDCVWEATAIGHCFLLQEQLLSIGELQVHWKYVINHVRNSGNICSHQKKKQMSLRGESQFDSAGAIGLYLTKSSEMIVSTASWKNIMESYFDQRIRDDNNLMERCPHYLLISHLGLHSHTCKVFRLLQGLSNVLNPHPGIPIAFIVFFSLLGRAAMRWPPSLWKLLVAKTCDLSWWGLWVATSTVVDGDWTDDPVFPL